ncbi:MAG: hypothetical protein R6U84_02235 [Candidatus Cloacimonadales bacterium]
MSKKNRKKQREIVPEIAKPSLLDQLFTGRYRHLILLGLLFIIISALHFQVAFQNYLPPASDTIQWRSSAQQLKEYNANNDDQALWNPAIFGGMPSYLTSFASKYPYINQLQRVTNKVMNWRVFLLFMMGLGVYILMLHLGFEALPAFIAALAFALSPHFVGLIEIGHNSKFKAVVYLPWIFWAVHYLWRSRSVLAMGLTSLFIIGQMRENHPQITYYTFIMLAIFWIFKLVEAIRQRKIKAFSSFTLLLLGAGLVSLLAIAQPYLSTLEYGEYTMRGGASGLERGYATSWSFHPAETLSFLVANFFGGVSPLYWGWMPFTQTSMYMGVLIFLLAIFAIFYSKNNLVKILLTVSLVSLLLSFGRHFPLLTNFMHNYFPYFNKFRVPAMILVLLQFAVVVLAGFGLKSLLAAAQDKLRSEKIFKLSKIALFTALGIFILILLSGGIFEEYGLLKSSETARYNPQQLEQLKDMRFDALVKDAAHSLVIVALALISVMMLARKKMKATPFLLVIALLVGVDLGIMNKRFLVNITPAANIQQTYEKSEADKFLLSDPEIFRIYPLAGEFGQNRWGYYHQSLGGYHGAKLQRYQDIIQHCMNEELQDRVPINWNIINMLNAKYVIFDQKLPLRNLEFAAYDRQEKMTIYKNKEYLPRAWFVEDLEYIAQPEQIWQRLNQSSFDPATTAIVEREISGVAAPQQANVEREDFGLHQLNFTASTDTTAFLVISEIYYPAGWKAFIDGEESEIFATNYILRGLKVPAGTHQIELKFEPESYALSLKLSLLGLILSLILVVAGAFIFYRKNFQGKIDYVIKE